MTQLLSVSKAARLANVSRSAIQKTIRSGKLKTFEGKVRIQDLLRVFLRIDLDADPILEQIEQIKSNASASFPWQQKKPPSAETLLRRLQTVSGMLVQTKHALDQNIDVLKSLDQQLSDLLNDDQLDSAAQNKIHILHTWLSDKRGEIGTLEKAMLAGPDQDHKNKARQQNDKARLFAKNLLLHVIAPSVQIIPSGHEFLIEGADTVLDAAIRSGLNVNYGCNNAECGGCKARLISGQVLQTRTPGYKLSAQEKQMGYVLMCCNTAVTDLTLEAAEAELPMDLPEQILETGISGMQQLNADTILLHLRTASSENFRFFAGQKSNLTTSEGLSQTLSIIGCPCDGQNLYFIVQKQRKTKNAEAFYASLKTGSRMGITGPHGQFFLRTSSTRPAIFIACDDGFAPIKSLIEHAISIDRIKAFHLYRMGSQQTPVYYHNLCRSWEDALDNFHYTQLEAKSDAQKIASRIVTDDLDLKNFDGYISGPDHFTQTIKNALIEQGLPADRLRFETISD